MVPSTLTDALAQARADWLGGQREAWSRYAACVAQLRALDQARDVPPAFRPLRPVPPRAHA